MIAHKSPISGIAAWQDTYVATAGYDNQVILWDQATERAVTRVLHDHLANSCAFSPDGTLLATSSSDYTARLWSVPDLRLRSVLTEQTDDVEMSAFHPTRALIATASRDHCLRVYDFDGTLVTRCEGHTADVISVEWMAGGDELVSSSDDGTVKRWSAGTGALLEDIDLGGVETDTVVVGRDGTVYAGNDDGEIVQIRGGAREVVPGHAAGVKRLVLDHDRDLLVSLSYDRMLQLWDTGGDTLRRAGSSELPDDVWPRSCAFAAGTTLVFGTFGATYRTYDYGSGEWKPGDVPPTWGVNAVCAHDGGVVTVGDAGIVARDGAAQARTGSLCNFLTPVGPLVVTGGQLGRLMDAATGQLLHQHKSPLNCGVRFVRDGAEHLLVGAYTGEGLVFRLDPDGGLRHVADLRLHDNAVKGVAVSDGLLFSVCADTGAAWHDAATLEPVHRVAHAHDRIANGCVGLAGGRFASVGRDLRLRLWEPDFSCQVIDTTHPNSVKCVAADPGGRLVATGSYHGHVKVYDRTAGRWTAEERPTMFGISSLCHDAGRGLFLAASYDGSVYEIPRGAAVTSHPLPQVRDPNRLPDRAAMGLPGSLVERLPHDVFAAHADLFRADTADLVALCEHPSAPFARRYAAGSVLGLLGDPRVRPDDPVMLDVPAGLVGIGLDERRVAEVADRWREVGVIDDWIRKECPRHPVRIDAFRIARYPVTNAEYRVFLDDTGAEALPTSWEFGRYPAHRANHPVWTVRPEHADAYARWLAARTGRRFRLPAEAEWEYAAGGGRPGHDYPWGADFLPDHANTVECGPLTTTPVGIYPAGRTVFGADDMAGNVEEFVADEFLPYPGGAPVADDLLRAAGSYRVARGGSFTRFGDLARCARRHGWFDRRIYAIGFRLAESA